MKRIFLFIPLVFLSACASQKPVAERMPPVMPATMLSPKARQSVRYGENVKAYFVGRYIDPNDPLVMHEAHTIYRVETTSRWNLHPNAPLNVPSGPVVGIVDRAWQRSPLSPRIAAEVSRQKAATQAVLEEGKRMNQVLAQFSKALPATAHVAAENALIQSEVSLTQERLDLLENQFRKMQSQMTQPENTFTPSPVPSAKGTNDW
jgi:hypothetical protein